MEELIWNGCPCLLITPCHAQCSCAHRGMSAGCRYCASYGSLDQRKARAEQIARSLAFMHGWDNCLQDACENAPFASVGGLASRAALVAPKYAPPGQEAEYLRGYAAQARASYGEDWQTCSFGWAPAVTIGGADGG